MTDYCDCIRDALNQHRLPFSTEEWEKTPQSVKQYLVRLQQITSEQQQTIAQLRARVETLEAKLKQDSSNSNRPPSSDSPFQKVGGQSQQKHKSGAKKGHKGHRQKLLNPTRTRDIHPERCPCGCTQFVQLQPYYTHQHIELPQVVLEVTHFVLYKGRCQSCGKTNKGYVPREYQTGYGARMSAFIVELAGIAGNSRDMVRTFCSSVLNLSISLGTIQKVIDRTSKAIEPHYQAIADKARAARINHLDETPWYKVGKLNWLWVMANSVVAFFMVHTNRSKQAFEALIGAWTGILVSDNYGVYQN